MKATTYFRALLRAHDNLLHSQRMFIGVDDLFIGDDFPSFKRLVRQQEKFARHVMADLKSKDEYKAEEKQ